MNLLRIATVLSECGPVGPLTTQGRPLAGQTRLAIANVDRSFRMLLSKKQIICPGPAWEKIPSRFAPSPSVPAAGSRLDQIIAHMCGISVKCLLSVRRAVADNDSFQARPCVFVGPYIIRLVACSG